MEPDPFDVFEVVEEDDFEEKPGAKDTITASPKPFRSGYNDLKSIGTLPQATNPVEFVE